jgi:hypothetical protein
MGVGASTVVRAEAADFFCDCWAVKIPYDERVGDVQGGVHYHAQGLGLDSFRISGCNVAVSVEQICKYVATST